MAYNKEFANRIREQLAQVPDIAIEEKNMFGGLAFMVNDKMCINVSDDNLMCRYPVALQEEIAEKKGFLPMIMKGKEMAGYCYVSPEGYKLKKDFDFWIKLCLDYNKEAKKSKRG